MATSDAPSGGQLTKVKLTLAGLVLILLVLFMAVYLLSLWFAANELERRLRDAGITDAKVDSMSIRVLPPGVAVGGVSGTGPNGDAFELDDLYIRLGVFALFNDALSLETIEISGLKAKIRETENNYLVSGFPIPKPSDESEEPHAADSPWAIEFHTFRVLRSELSFHSARFDTNWAIDRFEFADIQSYLEGAPTGVKLQSKLDEGQLESEASLHIDKQGNLSLDGEVELTDYEILDKAILKTVLGTQDVAGSLSLAKYVQVNKPAEGNIEITTKGKLVLADAAYRVGDTRMTTKSLTFDSEDRITLNAKEGGWQADLNYSLDAEQLDVTLEKAQHTVRHGYALLNGTASFQRANGRTPVSMAINGTLQGRDFEVFDSTNRWAWFKARSFYAGVAGLNLAHARQVAVADTHRAFWHQG